MTTHLSEEHPESSTINVCRDTAAHRCHRTGSDCARVSSGEMPASATSATTPELMQSITLSPRSEAAQTTSRTSHRSTTACLRTAIEPRQRTKRTRHDAARKAHTQEHSTDGPTRHLPAGTGCLDGPMHVALRSDVPRVGVGETPSYVRHEERGLSSSLCVRVFADRIRAARTP